MNRSPSALDDKICLATEVMGLSDVEVMSRDGKMNRQFHSFLLSINSGYLAYVLSAGRDGRGTGQQFNAGVQQLRLDLCASELELLREFVYTGRVKNITVETAQDLIVIADMYKIPLMTEYGTSHLKNQLCEANCLGIWKYATIHHCKDLASDAYAFALQNIWNLINAADAIEFCQLSCFDLLGLLANDRLNTPTEDAVFDLIWKWIRAAEPLRKENWPALLETIRYGLLDDRATKRLFERAKYCPVMVKQFFRDHATSDGVCLVAGDKHRSRIPAEIAFCVGGWNGGSPTKTVEVFDPKANRWFEGPSMTVARSYPGVCRVGERLYAISGYDAIEHFDTGEVLCMNTQTWSPIPRLHHRRCYVACATDGQYIYAAGGNNGGLRCNKVERFDSRVEPGQWSIITPMKEVRSDAGAAFLNGKLYVAGGFSGFAARSDVEQYDPIRKMWENVSDMNVGRSGISLIAHNGNLYVMGGFDGSNRNSRLDSVERYDPETNTWTMMPAMLTGRSNYGAAVISGQIYVVGGYNGHGTIPDVERFDPLSKRWEKMQSLPREKSGLRLVTMPNCGNYIPSRCYQTCGRNTDADGIKVEPK